MDVPPTRPLTPAGLLPHDDELVQRVVALLQSRLGSQVRDFRMSGCDGGLILHGQVRTYYCKQLAQEVVMEVSDRSIVANDIEVQCSDLPRSGCSQ